MKFRTLAVALFVPFALSACQSSQIGVSSFSGDSLNGAPIQSAKAVSDASKPEATSTSGDEKSAKKRKPAVKKATRTQTKAAKKTAKKKRKRSSFAKRKAKYRPIIAKYARKHGVPLKIAMAVVEVESSFRADATGRVGEIGLMQLLPRTARYIGVKGDLKKLYDPDTNIRWGMKYLAGAYHKAGGKTCRTILKYNAGHQATRMNPMSADYCRRVAKILARG
ncbi:MAG: transglycosylase SLT domain-containing protein [Pseudomonadota bacterium]